ncbi:MAG: chemotaxis protein CheW [Thermotogae bacterium]|nr:chemotaxis protein CheW [Thermotogota bacterium]
MTFALGDEIYAVPVECVREIVRLQRLTRVPLAPKYVEGIANLRGEVLPIMNLRKRLGLEEINLETAKVVILEQSGKTLGVIVDRTAQVVHISPEQIEEADTSSNFVRRVIRTKEGSMYMMLEVDKLLELGEDQKNSKTTKALERTETEKEQVAMEKYIQIVTFEMSGEIYGFPIEYVQEIIRYSKPTEVPDVPPYVKGIINLRGDVLPIVDLRSMLNLMVSEVNELTKVIVLNFKGASIGFIVDKISEVLRVPESEIKDPPPLIRQQGNKEVLGIVRTEENSIMIIDPSILISEEVIGLSEEREKKVETVSVAEEEQYVVFKVGEEEYGVPIEKIREINRVSSITKIPRAPKFLEGLMNLRGEVIPVIDLRKRFELELRERDEFTRVIVTDLDKKLVGFMVDSVEGVEKIPKVSIADAPDMLLTSDAGKFISSIARLKEKVILILDIEKILTEAETEKLKRAMERAEGRSEEALKTKKKTKSTKSASQTKPEGKKLKKSR